MTTARCNQLANQIINGNHYLTLATTDGQLPWASPLYYCTDPDYNFYFISPLHSLHSRYLKHNSQVAFAIFDSHAPEGKGNGIQASGTAKQLTSKEVPQGLKHFHTSFITLNPSNLQGKNPYRLYKLSPKTFYVLNEDSSTDSRLEANPKEV